MYGVDIVGILFQMTQNSATHHYSIKNSISFNIYE